MRRSAVWFVLAILFLAALTACGGGDNSSTAPTPAVMAITPSSVSLETGRITNLSVSVSDSKGNLLSIPPTISYASSNTAVATVSTAGAVCAGTWDTSFVVCTPGSPGTATITVTSGPLTGTAAVFTHAHIDRLVISPASVNCKSQGQTAQMTAAAQSNGTDITSTVGPIAWTTTEKTVATIDTNGLATAAAPGLTSLVASVGGINSLPASFTTCPVKTVHIHLPNAADTAFTPVTAATQQLAADILDSAGNTVTVNLNWTTSQPLVAVVSGTGLTTAGQPGTANITASCISPTCNIGVPTVYSNVVTATVLGSSANIVFATGTGATSLVPIDTSANTAGPAITLPVQPNSLIVNPLGTLAFLGSSAGLLTVNISTNVVTNDTAHPGTVLAISPDGNWVVVAGASTVFLVNTITATSSQTLSITGATAAAFTPDSGKLSIAAGNLSWLVTPGGGATPFAQTAPLAGATVLASGAFAYFGSTSGNSVLAVASCSGTVADTLVTPGSPNLVASLPNGKAVLAVDSPGIDVITPSTTLAGCPPPLSDTVTSKDFGQGAFTARQLIVLPDSSKAYVTSNLGKLLVYDVASDTVSSIPLAGGAIPFTAAATLDSKSVYVGASDNAVHRIDVAAGTDAQQIPVPFTPDLVALRPK